jgi:hypothetical protein
MDRINRIKKEKNPVYPVHPCSLLQNNIQPK